MSTTEEECKAWCNAAIKPNVARFGDPSLLRESGTLAVMFSTPPVDVCDTHDSEDVTTTRIATIIAEASMGYAVVDDADGSLGDAVRAIDYGYGPGAAVLAREKWMAVGTPEESPEIRNSIEVLGHLARRGMWPWFAWLVAMLTDDWSACHPTTGVGGGTSSIQERAKQLLRAPRWCPFLAIAEEHAVALQKAYTGSPLGSMARSNRRCACGCPWLSMTSGRNVDYVCMLSTLGRPGCGKVHTVTKVL